MRHVLILLAALSAIGADKLPDISVIARPTLTVSAPLEVLTIEIRIPRHPDNRGWCVEVDGPDLFHSEACEDLQGAADKVIHRTAVLHLDTEGKYTVRALLSRGPGKPVKTASQDVFVGVLRAGLVEE